jgi:K(+)-stimulated pyrophosphate-energized sodium pump
MFGFDLLLLAPVGSIAALMFAAYLVISILKKDEGNEEMKEIARAVRVGARAYLKRQYLGVSLFFVVVFCILLALALRKYLIESKTTSHYSGCATTG